ncbi:hypothetical protein M438DRAFT_385449 [Aureobasidium pullulans EXF-150]|uniref:Integral membrane protein n=1 Tax=Aureobasidium pullulans EXF-150 TaxID=1043002 RepID=A0A074X599_AURPU|nr:uncharacterized protein M438DRAFT_385449 [Aureobasidium pullulans EXF-150]KEQ80650.1 hypothetical protein M438DRAFT_385449 [Aureobasidium pullulans EXF-150]
MQGGGFLVSKNFEAKAPSASEMNVISIIFGFGLAVAMFTAATAGQQTLDARRRGKMFTTYTIMIWAEWISAMCIGLITYMWLSGAIKARLVFLSSVLLFFWTISLQCILQIIINRISVLMVRKNAVRLKIIVCLLTLVINISAFLVWLPALLQINKTWIIINVHWDRAEKACFLVMDGGLNAYFIYLVRTKLIANGLQKYNRLFYFNISMSMLSLSLDCILIGSIFLPGPYVNVQFYTLTYLLKLYIEMNITILIGKIVKSTTTISFGASKAAPVSGTNDYQLNIMARRNGRMRLPDEELAKDNSTFTVEERITKTVDTDITHD